MCSKCCVNHVLVLSAFYLFFCSLTRKSTITCLFLIILHFFYCFGFACLLLKDLVAKDIFPPAPRKCCQWIMNKAAFFMCNNILMFVKVLLHLHFFSRCSDFLILVWILLFKLIKPAITFGNFSKGRDLWRPVGREPGNLQLLSVHYCMKFLAETRCSWASIVLCNASRLDI